MFDGGDTYTLRMTLESVRGPYFELINHDAADTYNAVAVGEVRTYVGTIDECPDAIVAGILRSNGDLWAGIIFDKGAFWITLADQVDRKHVDTSPTQCISRYLSAAT